MTYQANGYISRQGYEQQFALVAGVNPRWDNLTAGWLLDEASGNRLDVLGTHTMVDNATVPSVTGILGNAIQPDQANSEFLSNGTVPGVTGAITVCLWAKRVATLTGTKVWVGHYAGAALADSAFILYNQSGVFEFITVDGTTQRVSNGTLALTLNQWHMFTFRKPAGNSIATVDIDDRADTAVTFSNPQINTATRQMTMGASDGPGFFAEDVAIDNVYYFANELKDDAWVTGMFNGGAGVAYPD